MKLNSKMQNAKLRNYGICSALVNQEGSVLLITLLIVTILVSVTVEFAYDVYVNTSALSNWTNAQKASLIARSGQTLSTNYLTGIGNLPYTYQTDINLPVEEDFGPDTSLTIKIEDENSKFNINTITRKDMRGEMPYLTSLQKLLEYLNINPSLAFAIADYIDQDEEPRLRDSEDNAKNSELWSIDELKLIKGMDQKTFETMKPFITVNSNGLININTAKLPVLVCLNAEMTDTLAKKIMDYRESTPFEDKAFVQRVSGMESIGPLLIGTIDVKSSYFRVISTATVNEITRVIESVMDSSMNIQCWREG